MPLAISCCIFWGKFEFLEYSSFLLDWIPIYSNHAHCCLFEFSSCRQWAWLEELFSFNPMLSTFLHSMCMPTWKKKKSSIYKGKTSSGCKSGRTGPVTGRPVHGPVDRIIYRTGSSGLWTPSGRHSGRPDLEPDIRSQTRLDRTLNRTSG